MKLADIKNWSPEIESKITEQWKKEEKFNFNPKTKKKIYSIDTPPPYINSPIHIGHAATYSYMDFFARYRRMKGYEVLFPLGLDRNGLPIEMAAEKKFDITPWKVGREKFIEYCEKLLQETSAESIDSFAKLGISFSSYKKSDKIGSIYHTDAPEYRALTQATFIDLYKKELIYEDARINNWDPKLRTTIADSEIEYKDLPSTFNDIKFKVKETGEEIVIGTTRPELICTCGMIIYNPEDKRYQKLEGKTAITPLFGEEVPIQEHPLAKMDKGTGLVMMCSAGDISDIQFFREMNLKPRIAIEKDGTMNEYAGFLKGLKVREAREKVIEELKKEKLLVKQQKITHSTPVSERSGAEIEFIEMPEFYLKQIEFKDDLRSTINKINFYPQESKKILDSWVDSVSIDWPISRRRYYATPIPLWHSDNLVALPAPGKYHQPWKEDVPKDAEVFENGKYIGKIKDFKGKKWKGEERVFDTWFDSSISELFMLKYKEDGSFFKKAFPASLRPQGKEIVRTWLYYTILRGYLATEKKCFEDVWIHQHITDEKGRKMSKSLGNVIDPQEILKEYGAEAFRLWAATEGDLAKQDLSCSKEKIRGECKTINKLLNMTRFVTQFKKPKKPKTIEKTDKVFIDFLDYEINQAQWHFDRYSFWKPMLTFRNFLWEVFASHYIELIKPRVYNEEGKFKKEASDSAKYTLYALLEKLTMVLYPIIPQVTSIIADKLKISLDEFPIVIEEEIKKRVNEIDSLAQVNAIMDFNREVWKAKKDEGLGLRDSLKGWKIDNKFRLFEKDLIACHNLKV
ncbi:valine--tRNA ligase [Candidatus Pacearchaeota archaeon]|nr:valine--tRNA ligase [Candidatus Pacearchaeota archaeon]